MATRDTSDTGGPERKTNEALGRMPHDASEAGHEMAEDGRQGIAAARTRVRSLLEQQTHRAADQLGTVATALHEAAKRLNDENNGAAAHYTDMAAERVEEMADMLRTATVDDIVTRVEGFARRQPEIFVGAAFAVGFLFARFVKSSGDRRHHATASHAGTQYGGGSYGGGRPQGGPYGGYDAGRRGGVYGASSPSAYTHRPASRPDIAGTHPTTGPTGTTGTGTGAGSVGAGGLGTGGMSTGGMTGTPMPGPGTGTTGIGTAGIGTTGTGTTGTGTGSGTGAGPGISGAAGASQGGTRSAAEIIAGTSATPPRPAGTVPDQTLGARAATTAKPGGTTP